MYAEIQRYFYTRQTILYQKNMFDTHAISVKFGMKVWKERQYTTWKMYKIKVSKRHVIG